MLESQMEPEDLYSRFRRAFDDVCVTIVIDNDALRSGGQAMAEKGTVAFGSSLHGEHSNFMNDLSEATQHLPSSVQMH